MLIEIQVHLEQDVKFHLLHEIHLNYVYIVHPDLKEDYYPISQDHQVQLKVIILRKRNQSKPKLVNITFFLLHVVTHFTGIPEKCILITGTYASTTA